MRRESVFLRRAPRRADGGDHMSGRANLSRQFRGGPCPGWCGKGNQGNVHPFIKGMQLQLTNLDRDTCRERPSHPVHGVMGNCVGREGPWKIFDLRPISMQLPQRPKDHTVSSFPMAPYPALDSNRDGDSRSDQPRWRKKLGRNHRPISSLRNLSETSRRGIGGYGEPLVFLGQEHREIAHAASARITSVWPGREANFVHACLVNGPGRWLISPRGRLDPSSKLQDGPAVSGALAASSREMTSRIFRVSRQAARRERGRTISGRAGWVARVFRTAAHRACHQDRHERKRITPRERTLS